jgi:hypothetical protein
VYWSKPEGKELTSALARMHARHAFNVTITLPDLPDLVEKGLAPACKSIRLQPVPEPGMLGYHHPDKLLESLHHFTALRHLHVSRYIICCDRNWSGLVATPAVLMSIVSSLSSLTFLKIGVRLPQDVNPMTCTQILRDIISNLKQLRCLGLQSIWDSRPSAPLGFVPAAPPALLHYQVIGEGGSDNEEYDDTTRDRFLENLSRLHSLRLRGTKLCCEAVCSFISNSLVGLTSLKLDLDEQLAVDWRVFNTLCCLSRLSDLEVLSIKRMHSAKQLVQVGQLLPHLRKSLLHLYLDTVSSPTHHVPLPKFRVFTEGLQSVRHLHTLSIERIWFGLSGARVLATARRHLRMLQEVAVVSCELWDEHVITIGNALIELPALNKIDMSENRLDEKPGLRLYRELADACPQVRSLLLHEQLPFLQCDCCRFHTLPRYASYKACENCYDAYVDEYCCPLCLWVPDNGADDNGSAPVDMEHVPSELNGNDLLADRRQAFNSQYRGEGIKQHNCTEDELRRLRVFDSDSDDSSSNGQGAAEECTNSQSDAAKCSSSQHDAAERSSSQHNAGTCSNSQNAAAERSSSQHDPGNCSNSQQQQRDADASSIMRQTLAPIAEKARGFFSRWFRGV